MTPKVSIIIPVYNTAALLPRCLESVVTQTLREVEIICVNDGSTDNSLEVLNLWAERDSRIKVLSQENGRQGKARNLAMSIAEGEFVGMIDSDDYIPSDYFERLYTAACEANADIAVCGIIKEKKVSNRVVVMYNQTEVAETISDKLRICNCPPDFHPVNKLYRRAMLERLGLRFEEGVAFEDVMFVSRALCESGRLVTTPNVAYRYVLNPTSTVKSRQTAQKQQQKYNAHRAMVNYMHSKGVTLSSRHSNITVKHYSIGGVCLWKIKESGNRRTLRLFDALPVWCSKCNNK
ncbi:MAG: glycosyltransferase [Rikenellaceae bacterium]|nr:glycosyltransferase [Rikenellaceae bacterium]